jgi:hypothetical protein
MGPFAPVFRPWLQVVSVLGLSVLGLGAVLALLDDLPPLPPDAEPPDELPLPDELTVFVPPAPPEAPPDLGELLDPPDGAEPPDPLLPPEPEPACPLEDAPPADAPPEEPPPLVAPPALPPVPPEPSVFPPPEFDVQPASDRPASRAMLEKPDVIRMGSVLFLLWWVTQPPVVRPSLGDCWAWHVLVVHVCPDRTTRPFRPRIV